jgi:uncharacterized protein (TIGR01732 family)
MYAEELVHPIIRISAGSCHKDTYSLFFSFMTGQRPTPFFPYFIGYSKSSKKIIICTGRNFIFREVILMYGYGGYGYGCGYPVGGAGYGRGFALIVVLFILLIIVGCSCWKF